MNDVTSPAAQAIIAVIPIVGIFIGGVILFFYLLWTHHETKLRIRTGTYKEAEHDFKTSSLLVGLVCTFVGITLTVIFALMDGFSYALLGGLLPLAMGLSFLTFYKINPSFHEDKEK